MIEYLSNPIVWLGIAIALLALIGDKIPALVSGAVSLVTRGTANKPKVAAAAAFAATTTLADYLANQKDDPSYKAVQAAAKTLVEAA